MVTSVYHHVETSERDGSMVGVIPYKGRQLLVKHVPKSIGGGVELGAMALVVGLIEGQYMIPIKDSVPATTVELVTDPSRRKELTDLLSKIGEKNPILFWNP